jgi:hypothetical protein
MNHQAYAFDHAAFERDLRPLLTRALESDDALALAAWIDAHLRELRDPFEGEPLPEDWRELTDASDVQVHGALALSKFYDFDLEMGLADDWQEIDELLEQAGASSLVLGTPLPGFDPGSQGSYFQSEAEVQQSLAALTALVEREPKLAAPLAPARGLLQEAVRLKRGLYVTF